MAVITAFATPPHAVPTITNTTAATFKPPTVTKLAYLSVLPTLSVYYRVDSQAIDMVKLESFLFSPIYSALLGEPNDMSLGK